MDREEMNRIIKFELEYIPRGTKGSNQNKLRFYYNAYRRRGISKGKSREECLDNAINKLKEDNPACMQKLKEFWHRNSVEGYDFRNFEAALVRLGLRLRKGASQTEVAFGQK